MNDEEKNILVRLLISVPWHGNPPNGDQGTRSEAELKPGDTVYVPASMARGWVLTGVAEYV